MDDLFSAVTILSWPPLNTNTNDDHGLQKDERKKMDSPASQPTASLLVLVAQELLASVRLSKIFGRGKV